MESEFIWMNHAWAINHRMNQTIDFQADSGKAIGFNTATAVSWNCGWSSQKVVYPHVCKLLRGWSKLLRP